MALAGRASQRAIAYLGTDVIKRWRADNGEANEENVGLGV